jgi:hypothetical protein
MHRAIFYLSVHLISSKRHRLWNSASLFVFVQGTVEGFVIDSSLDDISYAADASQMAIYFTIKGRTVDEALILIVPL